MFWFSAAEKLFPGFQLEYPHGTTPECAETVFQTSWWEEHPQMQIARSAQESFPFQLDQDLRRQAFACRCYFPLEVRGKIAGMWAVAGNQELNNERLEFLASVARLLELALERAILEARLQQSSGWFARDATYLRDELKNEHGLRLLTGESQGMKQVRRAIQQVANSDSTVLIHGETGTGKELVARAIHQLSARRDHLLVKVNCAALGPQVITSELFGHEQGAFTGATRRRIGRFELAHQGTIFLDEIGEVPPETQVLLLRVLQERVIERVGGNEPIAIDVRIIAATNQDLEKAVQEGRFRTDLFYRLNVFPLPIPPLRQRREDIPSLVNHFLQLFAHRMNKHMTDIPSASLELLRNYSWPGNVRELENVMERAIIVCAGPSLEIDPAWLPASLEMERREPSSLTGLERQTILNALERCQGKIYGPLGAAALLGLKPTTLYGKMRKHNISRKAAGS